MLETDNTDAPFKKDPNLPGNTYCRIWNGGKKPLDQIIRPGNFKTDTTPGGKPFAVLYLRDGSQQEYDLSKQPVSIEHVPSLRPEQRDLRAEGITAAHLKSAPPIPYEISYNKKPDSTICRDVFLASKQTASGSIQSIFRNFLKSLTDKLRHL